MSLKLSKNDSNGHTYFIRVFDFSLANKISSQSPKNDEDF